MRVFKNTIELHRAQPEITLEAHVRNKRIGLGTQVCSKYRIYLDLRFWILFREVELGRSTDAQISTLLEKIKNLVGSNPAICPISESVFVELMKQDDPSTRMATAKLINRLSLGVALVVHPQRIQQELCNAFYLQAGATDLIPLEMLIWTKLTSVLGEMHPSQTPFEAGEELVIQKAFYDHMWDISLYEMVKTLDFSDAPETDWQQTADRLNSGNRQHAHDIRSFKQAYRIEFEGGLSLFKSVMAALLKEIEQAGYKEFGEANSHLSDAKKFEKFARSVPTLHIGACCYAAVRWDQKRQLTGNDLIDFHHAEAALSYCHLFLTEKPLKSLLSQKHLGLNKDFPCRVVSSAQGALAVVGEIEG